MNPVEEQLYAQAAGEIANRSMSPGLMAKAIVDAEGDQNKATAFYIKYRVQQLAEELAAKVEEQDVNERRQAAEAAYRAKAQDERQRQAQVEEWRKVHPVREELKGIWKWLNKSW